jgi:parvulin-like peptidyl-prolyl isomerase
MSAVVQIGDRSLTAEQVIPLLKKYQLLPQLTREIVIEEALQDYPITAPEHLEACHSFYQKQQINSEADLEIWLQQQQLEREDLVDLIDRDLRLHKFKLAQWGNQLESYFRQRKPFIDRVVFSMIRVKDIDIAEELYFRLCAQETTFAELASSYSQGMEAHTKGISGPIALGKIEPALANLLATSPPGQILPPTRISDWWVVVQLETMLPAQLTEHLRQQLLAELFDQWVDTTVQKLFNRQNKQSPMLRPVLQPTI